MGVGEVFKNHIQRATLGILVWWILSLTQVCFGQKQGGDELEQIVVKGRSQTFYRLDSSTTGTKTPTDFLRIPQSIQVLTRQLMEDQAAAKITDLYRSISGVTEFSYAGISLRGFRQEDEIKYDGVAGDPFAGFSVPQIFNIERIEVLKGPSSMLFGVAAPGGMINYVTKKPTDTVESAVSIFGGNYNHFGISGEFSGPVNDNETVKLRLGGYSQKKKPWRYNSTESNAIIDVGLQFELGSKSSVLLQGIYMDQFMRGHRLRAVPVDDEGNFLANRAWNAAEPTDIQSLEATVFQIIGKHEFENGISSKVTTRYVDNVSLHTYHEPRGLADTDNNGIVDAMIREFRDQVRAYDSLSVTADNILNMEFGQTQHTILFGGDYIVINSDNDQRDTPNLPLDQALSLQNPVYGRIDLAAYNVALEADAANGANLSFSDDIQAGLFLQDQIKLNDLFEAVLGIRYAMFDTAKGGAMNVVTDEFDDNHLTARGGLIFRPTENISTYASYSESFLPQNGANQEATNGPFEPVESESYEIGIKGDLLDGAVQASAAAYQITKKNLLQADPDPMAPPDSFLSLGKVRSRGLEIDLIGDLTESWVLMFNYAYNDTRILEGATGTLEGVPGTHFDGGGMLNNRGGRFVNAPENTLGIWSRYELPSISSSIAAGVYFVDDRINLDALPVPSYAIYDLSWQTSWKNLEFQLNVKNLMDKEYAVSGFARGNFPGEPRTIIFQVTADLLGL